MEIPDDVRKAASVVLGIAWADDVMRQSEGALCCVAPENFRNLLENAETLARWVESLTGGVR